MSRGKRYDTEPKLNIKKVIAVFLFIAEGRWKNASVQTTISSYC